MKNYDLSFFDGEIVDNKLYFSNNSFNGLFAFDFSKKSCEYIDVFEKEELWSYNLHMKCIKYNDFLVFIPEFGVNINLYNTKTGEQKIITIPNKQVNKSAFFNAVLVDDKIWMFSKFYSQASMILDMNTFEIEEYDGINQWCKEHVSTKETISFVRLVREDDFIWMAAYNTGTIIRFNVKNFEIKSFNIGCDGLFGIFQGDDGFWLSEAAGNKLFYWKNETSEIVIYELDYEIKDGERAVTQVLNVGGQVYVVPTKREDIYCLDIEQDKFVKSFDYPKNYERFIEGFWGYKNCEEYLYLFPFKNHGILKVWYKEKNVEVIPIKYDCDVYMKNTDVKIIDGMMNRVFNINKQVKESSFFDLITFIDIIKR